MGSVRTSGFLLSPGLGVEVALNERVSARFAARVSLAFFDRSTDSSIDLGRVSAAALVLNLGLVFGVGADRPAGCSFGWLGAFVEDPAHAFSRVGLARIKDHDSFRRLHCFLQRAFDLV